MKVNVSKKQIIACVLIVILAIALGVVGVYGLSSRNADSGVKVLQDMRLQAILNTAGSGAVDAYVAAEKQAATQAVRAAGGGMKEVRAATAQAETEARARAEELGIGAVDLSSVDTAALGAALNVMVDAQQAYYAEEARAQAEYIELNKDAITVQEDTAEMTDDSGSEVAMEETIDLSGFVATEEMNNLMAKVDEAYLNMYEEIKVIFPALTDDILASLKATITSVMAAANDTFESQYDRAQAASGINPGTFGMILRQSRTFALSAVGLILLALVVPHPIII